MRSEDSDAKALLSPENRERFGIHYLGLSLILAWYYCLWFSPSMFSTLPITDDAVTFSWLSTLALTGFAFLATPFVFTKVHIYKQPVIMWVASAATCIATMAFGAFGTILSNLVFGFIVFPVIFAAGNAIMWVAWGELHAIRKSNFSLHKFSLSFGITMLIAMSVTTLLPHIASNIFVALLPLLSAMLYRKSNEKFRDKELPTLLPKATRAKTSRATFFISIAISITCVACYYNIAIIPIDQLLPNGMSYVAGIIGSAVVCLLLSLVQKLTKKEIATYRLLPWVVVACCAALGLYANGDPALYNVSSIITITLAGIFELFLVSYFGALSKQRTPCARHGVRCLRRRCAPGILLRRRMGHRIRAQSIPGRAFLNQHVHLLPLSACDGSRSAASPGKRHHTTDQGACGFVGNRRSLQRRNRRILAFEARRRNPQIHRTRIYHRQHFEKARHFALHHADACPTHLFENERAQAKRAARLHQYAPQ